MKIIGYSDGASNKKKLGGAGGFVLIENNNYISIKAFTLEAENTTNNQMEMTAFHIVMLLALDELVDSFLTEENEIQVPVSNLTIYTDSEYTKKGITEWIFNWKKKNWISSSGKPVENKFIWQQMDELFIQCKRNFKKLKAEWVRGHNGNIGNEIADRLATAGYNKNPYYKVKSQLITDIEQLANKPINSCDFISIDTLNYDYSINQKEIFNKFPEYLKLKNIVYE